MIYAFLVPLWIPLLVYEKVLRKCPRCKKRGRMNHRNFIKATTISPEGEVGGTCWTYYECSFCKAKLKLWRHQYHDVDEDEWGRHC